MDRQILGYCSYCKDPIYEDDAYVVENEKLYHPDCYQQMNTFLDSFGENVDYNVEE